ncbi:MAG: hypothetical protein ABI321_21715 [Polyangia bacterium]
MLGLVRVVRALVVLLATVGVLWCGRASADADAHAQLRRGIELQREASWSASITALERARSTGALSSAERAECGFYLGAAYLAIGSEAAARRELSVVLDLQPGFEPPPYTSPKVASLLGEVARSRATAAQLDPRPPRPSPSSDGLELGFEAHRTKGPVYGVVRFRMRGDALYGSAPLVARSPEHDGTQALVADVKPAHSGVLEYYADALEPAGHLVAGSAERPYALPFTEPAAHARKPSRGPSKLVWLAIPAGVIVGAAVGLGLYFGLAH